MLKLALIHPEILEALGEAGHGAQVLIADGNYPLATRSAATAKRVYLNFAPGLVTVTDVLAALAEVIPIEEAHVMTTDSGEEADIFSDFRTLLPAVPLQAHGRWDFYDMARGRDLVLAIATGEQRIYANILLTIGVVPPPPKTR
jgi:L-fucose mutarotase